MAPSRAAVPHVGDRLAEANDTVSALEAVSASASGNTGSGKSAYSIMFAYVIVGVPWLELGVHARGTEEIVADTAAMLVLSPRGPYFGVL